MVGQKDTINLQKNRSLNGFFSPRLPQPWAVRAGWNDELKGMSRNVYAVI